MTDKQWDTMLAVHNTAPFRLIRAAAPYFRVKDQEPRVVINISSTSGIHGNAYVLNPTATADPIQLTINKQRPSKLRRRQSRRRRTHSHNRQRMGASLRRAL